MAYLASLTLLFSYIEMILPRTVPFFRLGLGNTAILLAFDLPFVPFLLLSIIKALASSLMAGTLISPFFVISLVQSVSSGVFMYFLSIINRKFHGKIFSVYGISVFGSEISALVQILLCTLYLGSGTFALLGPMLLFNMASGIITAFFSTKISVKELSITPPQLSENYEDSNHRKIPQIFFALIIFFAAAGVFFIKNIPVLAGTLVLSLITQRLCKRRILILPHISLWVFIMISTVLVPEGKILYKLWNISITEGALLTGIQKSLRLSAVSALSQCAIILRPPKDSILALTLLYYKHLSDKFRTADGNIFKKIKASIT